MNDVFGKYQTDTQIAKPQSAESEPELTGHVYDGIQEYDNPTPGWWVWIFVLTVVFSIVYFFVVNMVGTGQLDAVAFYDRQVLADMKATGVLKADGPTLMKLAHDDDSLKSGAAIFATNCIVCHGRDGSGLTGPNLTDDNYINVTKLTDIPDVVTKGRSNGAMPGWARIGNNQIVQVSAYVASLRGQNKRGKPVEPNARTIPPWSE